MATKTPSEDPAAERRDGARQTAAQRAVLGGGGEVDGRPEPKSTEDWHERGAEGGVPGRPPVALGGSSAGQSDRKPADPAGAPAAPPPTTSGHRETE